MSFTFLKSERAHGLNTYNCFHPSQLLFLLKLSFFKQFLCPFEKPTVVFESVLGSQYNRMFQAYLVHFLLWYQLFSQGALVPFKGKQYLKTTSWTPGILIATGLCFQIFSVFKACQIDFFKDEEQDEFLLIFPFQIQEYKVFT